MDPRPWDGEAAGSGESAGICPAKVFSWERRGVAAPFGAGRAPRFAAGVCPEREHGSRNAHFLHV